MRKLAHHYNLTFQTELDRLNPAQRAAVEKIDGPVMVLAGPGTGKTHLLAARIGNILLETDTGAHNILCLTFTEAGVKAMRERLLKFIGPEAHRVGIFTFHGFCSNLIQQNLHYFGRPGLEPLGDLEKIRIVRRLLDDLAKNTPLKQGYNVDYFYEPHLMHLFAAIKAENWDLDLIRQAIDRYVAELPEKEGFYYVKKYRDKPAGAPKEGEIELETLRMERLRAALDLFPRYQEALRKLRRYDYGDMIGWVLRAFHEHPSLLRAYQERYQYVLIDEFQDTNGAQDEIIRRLTDYWDRPNVFIVGDDDQAIYEFQGARLRSMTDFFQRHAEVKVVTLTDNYRSRQAILDAASALIDHNTKRIGKELPGIEINKHLTSAVEVRPDPTELAEVQGLGNGSEDQIIDKSLHPVRLQAYTNQNQELAALLAQLQAWHEDGVPWEEMAVIYAKHGQATRVQHLLERVGIPYRSKRRPNILDGVPVRQLRQLLTYLQLESSRPKTGEHLIYRLLHYRCFGTDAADLAQLNLARLEIKDQHGFNPSWRTYLQQPNHWPLRLRARQKLERVAAFLNEMIGLLGSLPLAEFVELVMNGSGLLATALRHPKRAERVQQLATFSDFVLAELSRRPRLRLEGLLDTLLQMEENRIELPVRSHLDQAEAVLLVTAHSAKGLEFDKVWLLDCAESKWGTTGGRRNQFKLPDTLTYSGAESEEEARRRLFFVAMTRAKTELVMSYAELDAKDKAQQKVAFLDELTAATDLAIEHTGLEEAAVAQVANLQLQPTDLQQLPGLESAAIAELLKDFRLSVSALYAYLDCPTKFFYEKLLRVPDREREVTLYGSALHDALETYFNRMKKDAGFAFSSREELLFNFQDALGRRRGLFSPRAFEQRLAQGRRELGQYYDTYRGSWTTEVEVELAIRNVEVDGIPLTGKIDRVDILSDAYVRVVDYKTSSSAEKKARAKLRPPTKANPHGGNYWRQLTFYKLLYDNRPGNIRRVKNAAISFLLVNASGEQPEAELNITRKDTDALRTILHESWERIQAQDFISCGKEDCEWCRFVEELREDVPLGEVVDELDDRS
ncbi:MAG: ATP-dependent DNA helicase [Bacteroidota bacterium]